MAATYFLITIFTLALSFCPGTGHTATARKAAGGPFTVAMITWRGDTLAESGFVDGLNGYGDDIRLKKFPVNQDLKLLKAAIAALQKDTVDLIYIFGTTATKHVLSEIKETPVVFNIVTRPVESGIINDWESSGNNATGVSSMVPIRHQLEALRKIIRFTRLGIIYNPLEQNSIIQRDLTAQLADRFHFSLHEFKISSKAELPGLLENINTRVDAVFLPSDSMIRILGNDIMTVINARQVPSLSAIEDMVKNDSALIGLVPDYYQLGHLAASKAHLILQGKHPSEIPSSTLDHFNIIVNMNTARQIGIDIPTSILIMADTIIR